ncbi:MAG: TlpA family protein disulfide reductase [Planctomycetota bacterium]|jgi:thiol-disulfide isomerase/thioredoxin
MRSLCLLLTCLVPLLALEVGQPAPALDDLDWVQGSAPDFSQQWTVVEFWATWCPPCVASIPHLSKLNSHYGERLAVVGISNEDRVTVEPFLAEQGESMNYAVAVSGTSPARDAYMDGINGIPHAFLVNPHGSVIWHGHPMELDQVIEQAMAGTYDPQRAGKISALEDRIEQAAQASDLDAVLSAGCELLSHAPGHDLAHRAVVYVAQNRDDAALYRSQLTTIDISKLSAHDANALAWTLLTNSELPYRNLDVAVAAARRAASAAPEDAAIADTLARAHYLIGDIAGAISEQQRAISLDDNTGLRATLAYYQQAAALAAP